MRTYGIVQETQCSVGPKWGGNPKRRAIGIHIANSLYCTVKLMQH